MACNTSAKVAKLQAQLDAVNAELPIASERYKSGQYPTAEAFAEVERLVRKKLRLKARIAAA